MEYLCPYIRTTVLWNSCLPSIKDDYNKLWNMKETFQFKYNKNQSSSNHTPE